MSATGLYAFDIVVCVVERTVLLAIVVASYYKGAFGVLVFKVYPYFFTYFGDEVKAFATSCVGLYYAYPRGFGLMFFLLDKLYTHVS